jgi:hypothetical protein
VLLPWLLLVPCQVVCRVNALQRRCNAAATCLQHRCNIAATSLQHRCNIAATSLPQQPQKQCQPQQHCNIPPPVPQQHQPPCRPDAGGFGTACAGRGGCGGARPLAGRGPGAARAMGHGPRPGPAGGPPPRASEAHGARPDHGPASRKRGRRGSAEARSLATQPDRKQGACGPLAEDAVLTPRGRGAEARGPSRPAWKRRARDARRGGARGWSGVLAAGRGGGPARLGAGAGHAQGTARARMERLEDAKAWHGRFDARAPAIPWRARAYDEPSLLRSSSSVPHHDRSSSTPY